MSFLDTINQIGKRFGTGASMLTGYNPSLTADAFKNAGSFLASPFNTAYKQTQTAKPIAPAMIAPSPTITAAKSEPLTMNNSVSNPIIQTQNAPVNTVNTTNVQTQTATIQAQIADIQKQIDAATKAGYSGTDKIQTDAKGAILDKPEPSLFDKLLGMQKTSQEQIANAPAVPTLEDTTNKILAKFGFTPESFKEMGTLTTELGTINDQINTLETQRQQELSRTEMTPGGTIGSFGAEESRINREYSIRQAGLGGKAAVVAAKINILQGAYDKAEESAKSFVDYATAERKQFVDDIRYSMDFYKDVYSEMDKSDRDRVNNLLDYQVATLNAERDDYWKQLNYELDVYKAQKTGSGTGTGSSGNLDIWANGLMTGQFGIQNVPLGLRDAVLGRIQELGGNVISTTFAGKAKESIAAFNTAEGMLNQIESLSAPVANAGNFVTANLGGVLGWLGGKTGADSGSRLYMTTRDAFLSQLTRAAGEKGVLTDQDVARIKNALPALNDTKIVKEQKLKNLKELFTTIKTGSVSAYTNPLSPPMSGGGSSLSQFEK